jgi:DNA replicative helicase MCM subunit Mcm2 (Cdc46/Mcm family)
VNWINLASDKGQWRAVLNVAINFQVLEMQEMPEILKQNCLARTVSWFLYLRKIGNVSGMKCLTFVCALVEDSRHVSDNPLN